MDKIYIALIKKGLRTLDDIKDEALKERVITIISQQQ